MAKAAISPQHICGLVVGEGCFYVESAADTKYRSGWRIRPAFCIEMRYDEREILEEVQRQLGCGKVYDLDFGRYRGYEAKGWKPHVKYRVGKISDLHDRVVPFFQQHRLFGRKQRAFELFTLIVESLHREDHRSTSGLDSTRELARQLKEHNKKG